MNNEPILNERYRLEAQLGSGGMAVIYRAVDERLGRRVAVKILRPSLTDDPTFLTRFRNEARSIANLSHPNIVTVHDVGNEGQTQYIVMEYIEGRDLKKIIRAMAPFDVERALSIATQICHGIGYAHRAGLVHADVKPQNILVTDENVVKVTDFGIAQAFSDTQPPERQSVVWGSPHYFSPEQAQGEKPTPASDVYSIGIVMFEMLTGRLPYSGSSQQELALAHIRDDVPRVSEFFNNVSQDLDRIIYKVMSKQPAARYRMADQLGHVLESLRDRGGHPLSAPVGDGHDARTTPPEMPRVPPPPPADDRPRYSAPYSQEAPPRETTARYGMAPRMPESQPYHGPAPPAPRRDNTPPPMPIPTPPLSATGRYAPQPRRGPQFDDSAVDVVTVMLAILAFVAVAGLIPLYIFVFLARS